MRRVSHEGMIELDRVTKRYGDMLAVDDVTFTIQPGVVTGFLGPHGAGKSTTMRLMLGLDAPTSGEVRVNGRHYRDLEAPLGQRLGIASALLGDPRTLILDEPVNGLDPDGI